MTHSDTILILDFGSQVTQLIARKVRECGVYAEIHPFNISEDKIRALNPKGIILSGGPASVYADGAPHSTTAVFSLGVPVLGICYGLQLIAEQLGGTVNASAKREFGRAYLEIDNHDDIFANIPAQTQVWMSHGDSLTALPAGFHIIAHTENAPICAIRNSEQRIWGLQFHPEVFHTTQGTDMLRNFAVTICGAATDWNAGSFIKQQLDDIRAAVGDNEVICALSGGVDSTVAAVLVHKAIGDKLHCIHIDTGLMRSGESTQIEQLFREHFSMSIDVIDGSETFLSRLA
ncbi:MAG: glutamine-hydrolyzing GMP synthase, partial [Candidatus Kapabacteria bacterium]|nr:glutamine-hydrolyzing GMP synthase [Candidatus Kapabacteria bacterium]